VSAGVNRLAPARDRMSMWAVGDQIDAYARYRKSLTFAEHIAITGGQGWDAEHRFDRHNVLTAELALRVAEFCDVATVLGEKQMGLPALLSASGLDTAQPELGRKPDAGIIRHDGLVIAIETTASIGETFRRKVAQWARLLQRHPSYELPMVVLIVDVSTPSQATSVAAGNTARVEIQAAIREAVRDYPGTTLNRTADRIGTVSWPAWVPAPGEATRDFLDLRASFLDRSHGHDDGWRDVRLLDEDEMPYREGSPSAGEVIAANSRMLAGTPHWLRPGTIPRTDQYLLDRVDTTGVAELTDPAVPDPMTGPGFTESASGRKWRPLISLDDATGRIAS